MFTKQTRLFLRVIAFVLVMSLSGGLLEMPLLQVVSFAEELQEETVVETVEEAPDETTEKTLEEISGETLDETTEKTQEEPIEETVEEPSEEPSEDIAEETEEESIEVTEESAFQAAFSLLSEEPTEEPPADSKLKLTNKTTGEVTYYSSFQSLRWANPFRPGTDFKLELIADCEVTLKINSGLDPALDRLSVQGNLEIDLHSYRLYTELMQNYYYIEALFTVQGGNVILRSTEGTGVIESTNNAVYSMLYNHLIRVESGSFTMESGTLRGFGNTVPLGTSGTAVINGGTITSENYSCILSSGDLTINGGTITASALVGTNLGEYRDYTRNGICQQNGGSLTLNGGTIIGNGRDEEAIYSVFAVGVGNESTMTVPAASTVLVKSKQSCVGLMGQTTKDILIAGGTFESGGDEDAKTTAGTTRGEGVLTVVGGKFDHGIGDRCFKDPTQNLGRDEEGNWVPTVKLYSVGYNNTERYYATLDEAMAALEAEPSFYQRRLNLHKNADITGSYAVEYDSGFQLWIDEEAETLAHGTLTIKSHQGRAVYPMGNLRNPEAVLVLNGATLNPYSMTPATINRVEMKNGVSFEGAGSWKLNIGTLIVDASSSFKLLNGTTVGTVDCDGTFEMPFTSAAITGDARLTNAVIGGGTVGGELTVTGNATIRGGTFAGPVNLTQGSITGGTFEDTVTFIGSPVEITGSRCLFKGELLNTENAIIKGGTFAYPANYDWSKIHLPDEYYPVYVKDNNGGYIWQIEHHPEGPLFWVISADQSEKFLFDVTRLNEVISDGDCIELMRDVDSALGITIKKNNVVLDLNEFTFNMTGEDPAVRVAEGVTLFTPMCGEIKAKNTALYLEEDSSVYVKCGTEGATAIETEENSNLKMDSWLHTGVLNIKGEAELQNGAKYDGPVTLSGSAMIAGGIFTDTVTVSGNVDFLGGTFEKEVAFTGGVSTIPAGEALFKGQISGFTYVTITGGRYLYPEDYDWSTFTMAEGYYPVYRTDIQGDYFWSVEYSPEGALIHLIGRDGDLRTANDLYHAEKLMEEGDTLRFNRSWFDEKGITISKNDITLDLNGSELTVTGNEPAIKVEDGLTGVIVKNGTVSAKAVGLYVGEGAAVTADFNVPESSIAIEAANHSELTVDGGSYSKALTLRGDSAITGGSFGGNLTVRGSAVISGGEFAGNAGIRGSADISGGSFKKAVTIVGNTTISGGEFEKAVVISGTATNGVKTTAAISGGTFKDKVTLDGKGSIIVGSTAAVTMESTITGGTFEGDVVFTGGTAAINGCDSLFKGTLSGLEFVTVAGGKYAYPEEFDWSGFPIAEGYYPVYRADGQGGFIWRVENHPAGALLKLIDKDSNERPVYDFSQLYDLVSEGDTLVLLRAYGGENGLRLTRSNITLDLNSQQFTVTGDDPAIAVESGLTGIAVKNGTVSAKTTGLYVGQGAVVTADFNVSASSIAIEAADRSKLTINGGKYVGVTHAIRAVNSTIETKKQDVQVTSFVQMIDFAKSSSVRKAAYESVGKKYDEKRTKWKIDGKKMSDEAIDALHSAYTEYLQAAAEKRMGQREQGSFTILAATGKDSREGQNKTREGAGDAIYMEGGQLRLNNAVVNAGRYSLHIKKASAALLRGAGDGKADVSVDNTILDNTAATQTDISFNNSTIISENSTAFFGESNSISIDLNNSDVISQGVLDNSESFSDISFSMEDSYLNNHSVDDFLDGADMDSVNSILQDLGSVGGSLAASGGSALGGLAGGGAASGSASFTTCFSIFKKAVDIAVTVIIFESLFNGEMKKEKKEDVDENYVYLVMLDRGLPKGFDTLAETFAAAGAGDPAMLVKASYQDPSAAVVAAGQHINFTLGGNSLTLTAPVSCLGGELNFTGPGNLSSNGTALFNTQTGSVLNLSGGITFNANPVGVPAFSIGGTAMFNDGVFNGNIDVLETGNLTINSGSFNALPGAQIGEAGLKVGGKTIVNGGTFNGGVFVSFTGDLTVNDGLFNTWTTNTIDPTGTGTAQCSIEQSKIPGSMLRITGGTFMGDLLGSNMPAVLRPILDIYALPNFMGGTTLISGGTFQGCAVDGMILPPDIVAGISQGEMNAYILGLLAAYSEAGQVKKSAAPAALNANSLSSEIVFNGSTFNGISVSPTTTVHMNGGSKFGGCTYLLAGHFAGSIPALGGQPMFFLPTDLLDFLWTFEEGKIYTPSTNDFVDGVAVCRIAGRPMITYTEEFALSLTKKFLIPGLPVFQVTQWNVTTYIRSLLNYLNSKFFFVSQTGVNQYLDIGVMMKVGSDGEVYNPIDVKKLNGYVGQVNDLIERGRDIDQSELLELLEQIYECSQHKTDAENLPYAEYYGIKKGDYENAIPDTKHAESGRVSLAPYVSLPTNTLTIAVKQDGPDGARFLGFKDEWGSSVLSKEDMTLDEENGIYYYTFEPKPYGQPLNYIALYETPDAAILRADPDNYGEYQTLYFYSDDEKVMGQVTQAMENDDVIQLMNNVSSDTVVTLDKNVSLNLRGYSLTVPGLNLNGDIGLLDSSEEKTGVIQGTENTGREALIQIEAGELFLESGTINASGYPTAIQVSDRLLVQEENYPLVTGASQRDLLLSGGKIRLAGGEFSFKGEAGWCEDGFEFRENTEKTPVTYRVVAKNREPLGLVSCLSDGAESAVGRLIGGGLYYEGQQVHISAEGVPGMKFVGWYDFHTTTNYAGETRYVFDRLISTEPMVTLTMGSEERLIAGVYERDTSGSVKLTVTLLGEDCALSINGKPQTQQEQTYSFDSGTQITLTCESGFFRGWYNGSMKLVGTGSSYTFTLVSETQIFADAYTGSESIEELGFNYGYVEYISGYGQLMKSEKWYMIGQHTLPELPTMVGGINGRWSIDGVHETSIEEIQSTLAASEEHYVQVKAVYDQAPDTHLVTVYENGVARPEPVVVPLGKGINIKAADLEGRSFYCWAADPEGTQVLSYRQTYFLTASQDVTLYALYVDEGEEPEARPVMVVSNFYAVAETGQLRIETTRSVPEGYALIEHGILRTREEALKDHVVLDIDGVSKHVADTKNANGVYTLSVRLGETSKMATYYVRGYMIVRNLATGEIETLYSQIKSGCFNDMIASAE